MVINVKIYLIMLKIIRLIGLIECLIGLVTLGTIVLQPVIFSTSKTPAVLAFVGGTALISFAIGLGLLKRNERARAYLVYFSGYILIEKLLIFAGMLTLNGRILETVAGIPAERISFAYHAVIVAVLVHPKSREAFIP